MDSPARRHRIQHEAAAAKQAAADDQLRPDLTQYELHLAQLAEHKRRLKQIQSIERKIAFKRKILPDYAAYIDGVLSADGTDNQADDVLTTIMVWRIDTGDIAGALAIGEYVLAHHVPLPDQYERTAATVLAEEVAEHSLRELGNTDPDAGDLDLLRRHLDTTATLVANEDMPDQVSAKLHKALGYALRGANDAEALGHLRRAVELNDKVGVKKDIERLERDLKKHQEGE